MADFVHLLTTLRQQMSAELTRSDVLRALIWPNAGLLLALSSALIVHAPTWVLIALVTMLSTFMLLYAAAYIFFALTEPDALRSEKYKLQKMAIEQGLFGDSTVGIVEMTQIEARPLEPIKTLPDSPHG